MNSTECQLPDGRSLRQVGDLVRLQEKQVVGFRLQIREARPKQLGASRTHTGSISWTTEPGTARRFMSRMGKDVQYASASGTVSHS